MENRHNHCWLDIQGRAVQQSLSKRSQHALAQHALAAWGFPGAFTKCKPLMLKCMSSCIVRKVCGDGPVCSCGLLLLQDGVVLAADTRSTSGSTVADKNCEKIHYIAPNIYCCGAGTAADTMNVTGVPARTPHCSHWRRASHNATHQHQQGVQCNAGCCVSGDTFC